MLVPNHLALFVAVVVAIAGLLILWSNPSRSVNRAVFAGTLQMTGWLLCWHMAANSPERGLFWLKMTCTVGALAPLNFWIVKQCILVDGGKTDFHWFRGNLVWGILLAGIAVLPFTEFFIPAASTKTRPIYGWGYYAYIWGLLCLYGILFRDTFRKMKTLTGAPRLEMQVWLGGGCVLALAIYILMALSAVTKDPSYRRLQPLAVLLFYAGTAFAVTTYRIFDARHIVLVAVQKVSLVAVIAATAFGLEQVLEAVLPQVASFVITTALALWLASLLNGWLDRVFQFYPQATVARQAAFTAAQRESRVEKLEAAFGAVLEGWGQSDHVVVICGTKDSLSGSGITLPDTSPVTRAMKQLRWVTPERLSRERATPDRHALGDFLREQRLAVMVISEGPSLTTLVGVGYGASRRPFTYPQVTQLMELASIMESALERAHFSAKVQHAEQLATVGLLGASLAHEIRNPLVSIKTFVQLLPTHHHDPAFREKFFRLIGDEVGRIDQLTEQLLDLASPRTYSAQIVELHPLLRSSLDLVATKAAHRNVEFLTEFTASPDHAFTDASAAKQVMLNLCFNAIQAVESHSVQPRWVRVATRNLAGGIEMAVADSGPGIPPEIRSRLFQPFQTTKSTGFGLGLAICSDILANLNASISVDPPADGHGATFRVTFPCQPLSS